MRRAVIMGALVLAACREEPVAGPQATAAPIAIAPGFDDASFRPAAKAFVDAALAYGGTCDMEYAEPGDWFAYVVWEKCSLDAKDLDPIEEAGKRLDAVVGAATLPPAAEGVWRAARTFRGFLDGVRATKVARGTLRLYQDVALAFDAYAPDAKVPTDPPRFVGLFFEKNPNPKLEYIWSNVSCRDPEGFGYVACDPGHPFVRTNLYAIHRQQGLPLRWRTGPAGPFLADD